MSYSNGNIVVEVSSGKELADCFFELYLFDFLKGSYNNAKPDIKDTIGVIHMSQDSGIYRFKYGIPNNCRVKCVITDGKDVLLSKERFIGDRHKITVEV